MALAQTALYLMLLYIVLTVLYFLHVHLMANLLLVHGSSRKKSLFVGATISLIIVSYTAAVIGLNNIVAPKGGFMVMLGAATALVSYILMVMLGKIFYVRKVYDTTILYAILIAEGLFFFLKILILVFRKHLLGVV